MTSRLFQSVVLQMKEATDCVIGVIDNQSQIIACTDLARVGASWDELDMSFYVGDEVSVFQDYSIKKLSDGGGSRSEYAVFVSGIDDVSRSVCVMASIALNAAKASHDDKHDTSTFIKNILLGNILPGDVYIRSRELQFESSVPRAIMLIRQIDSGDVLAIDVVQSLFPDKEHDFVISVGEREIALVKEVNEDTDTKTLGSLAKAIEETLKSEIMVRTTIGIGSVFDHLKDLAASYKEARLALDVGCIFESDKTVINYENLGIGRLIYQLPTTMCKMFLSEVFKKNKIENLDRETLETITKFFENNLNVSETSRKLFVHRNTLVYRLEKIKKLTGLDLREFDHAIIFNVALMVKRYLSSRTDAF